jgi:hypothetical protein
LLLYPPTPEGDWIPVYPPAPEGHWIPVLAAVRLMFGPPLFAFVVVFVPLWVWDGFKPHKKSN